MSEVRGKVFGKVPLAQVLRIKRLKIFRQKHAVLADQFTIEPDFAAAPFGTLDEDHVPVNGRAVAVVASS